MASLVDEQTTSDIQDIQEKVIQQLKTYAFFIYYERGCVGEGQSMNLQKLAFKLKQDKNLHQQKYGDNNKNILLHFSDLDNEHEVAASLMDLKTISQENKTKIIFFSREATLLTLIIKASLFNLNISNIPLCIYTPGIHSDLSKFLGWGQPSFQLSAFALSQIEPDIRKWVESPTQKIDMWLLQMRVDQKNGLIHKIGEGKIIQDLSKDKIHRQCFLSSFSIGYHPQLMMNYQSKKSKENGIFNKFLYSLEGWKKFCCVGQPTMKSTTGIVKVDFTDEKGNHEMLKQFRQFEGDEEEDLLESRKPKNRKKLLTISANNIDRFYGQKIKNENSRMNDGKLELMIFTSMSECRGISSISGELNMRLSAQSPVYIQVNDSCYRLEQPLELKIRHHSKVKVVINKQMLSC